MSDSKFTLEIFGEGENPQVKIHWDEDTDEGILRYGAILVDFLQEALGFSPLPEEESVDLKGDDDRLREESSEPQNDDGLREEPAEHREA